MVYYVNSTKTNCVTINTSIVYIPEVIGQEKGPTSPDASVVAVPADTGGVLADYVPDKPGDKSCTPQPTTYYTPAKKDPPKLGFITVIAHFSIISVIKFN